MNEKNNIRINQKAGVMRGVIGYQTNHSPNAKKEWHETIWGVIFVGIIITVVGGLIFKKWGGKVNEKNKKIGDVEIHQTADVLMIETKGADFNFNRPENMDLGKINIHQQSPLMRDVTGLQIHFGSNAGEINVHDHVLVEQKSNNGSTRLEINGHLPGVEVTFNKKTE